MLMVGYRYTMKMKREVSKKKIMDVATKKT